MPVIDEKSQPLLKVVTTATFSTQLLLPVLEHWFDVLELDAELVDAGYQQLLQEMMNTQSTSALNSGINLFFVRVEDFVRNLTSPEPGQLVDFIDEFVGAVELHRARSRAKDVVLLCPSYSGENQLDYSSYHDRLLQRLDNVSGLKVVDANEWLPLYGVHAENIHDPIRDEIGHLPFTDAGMAALSTIAFRNAFSSLLPLKKVIVVDCDNTLWGGVVGEDGWEGVELERHHVELHRTLSRLAANGVVVCLCSKNVESDVWSVFDNRADFELSRENIVAAKINWQSKSANIRELAGALNLGLDSFVFLDDNPVECAEVRIGCPEVLTLQWMKDEDQGCLLLDHIWEFDLGETTAEDKARTQLYQQEYSRKEIEAGSESFEEFLKNLDLRIDSLPIDAETVSRASQMTMRTNQLNFTTIRRSESELNSLLEDPLVEGALLKVSDRFGDYGIVGLVIVRVENDRAVLDTFLMSCRVLGRGVEHKLAQVAGQLATLLSHDSLDLRVEFTAKNLPAQKFLRSIAGTAELTQSEHALGVTLATSHLQELVYDPNEPSLLEEIASSSSDGINSESTLNMRAREAQIERTAFELGDATRISDCTIAGGRKVKHRLPSPSVDTTKPIVIEAFAEVLGKAPHLIESVDDLDALECASIDIVNITVRLLDSFPSLPKTLLFEHPSISKIIKAITSETDAEPTKNQSRTNRADSQEIAIVGIGLRCAGADTPTDLWEMLKAGESSIRPVDPDREYFFDQLQDSRPHWAGLLDQVDVFDAEVFNTTPREAQWLDPQLRLFMHAAWNALDDAGLTGCKHSADTGVFVGVMYDDYANRANKVSDAIQSPYRSWEGFSIANRFSQFMGYRGPSFAIETACSSSATAIHQARLSLLAGDCDVAVVGGVNLILDPIRFAQLGKLGILSPDGKCRPFGHEANGTVMGEGVGVAVLKTKDAALADGDRIYAILKGSGISTGAGSVGFTAPNPVAQAEATRRAIVSAGIDPRSISYVETHGTGTALGDPIEVRGLSLAYEDRSLWGPEDIEFQCAMGSIKPNIGHLEAGAGVMGLIKTALQLFHRQKVPSITSEKPSEEVDFRNGAFKVQRESEEWIENPVWPRRAGLNSFGVGGSNVHLILEEAPEQRVSFQSTLPASQQIMLISANTPQALERQKESLRVWTANQPLAALSDLCANSLQRHVFEHRTCLTAAGPSQLSSMLLEGANGPGSITGTPLKGARTAFLFTGQGSQYVNMGKELYAGSEIFASHFDEAANHVDATLGCSLKELVFGSDVEDDRIHQTAFTQPALFALQYALAKTWMAWGVAPDLVIGHSIGEYAAACIAGGIALEDAALLVCHRGRLMGELPQNGAMVSVNTPRDRAEKLIKGHDLLAIAAANTPSQTVISGSTEQLDLVIEKASSDNLKIDKLKVSHAFHSPMMRPMIDEFRQICRSVAFAPLDIPFISTVTAEYIDKVDEGYWCKQILAPVAFHEAVSRACADSPTRAIEIGPHPVLVSMARPNFPSSIFQGVSSLIRGESANTSIVQGLAEFIVSGGAVEPSNVHGSNATNLLPTYRFADSGYWIDQSDVPSKSRSTTLTPNSNLTVRNIVWKELPLEARAWREVEDLVAIVGDETFINDFGDIKPDIRGFRWEEMTQKPYHWLCKELDRLDKPGTILLVVPELVDGAEVAICSVFSNLANSKLDHELVVLTRGVFDNSTDLPASLSGAFAVGAARSFAVENPNRWRCLIDLASDAKLLNESSDAVAAILLNEERAEDEWRIDSTSVRVPRIQNVSYDPSSFSPNKRSTYLITGGTGALGTHCARWLGYQGVQKVVLGARSACDGSTTTRLVDELTEIGVEVERRSVDLSDADQVSRLLRDINDPRFPLKGIIHCAGEDQDRTFGQLDDVEVAAIVGGKAQGALNLHQASKDLELEAFVLFSSMSSVIGTSGKGAYAGANAMLDVIASKRRDKGLVATSIAWGPWRNGGMASDSQIINMSKIGNIALAPKSATKTLGNLINGELSNPIVMDVDWQKFAPILEARRPKPLIHDLLGSNSEDGESGVGSASEFLAHLSSLEPDTRLEAVISHIVNQVATVFEIEDASSIDPNGDLFEMGLDSLMAIELAVLIEKDFDFEDPSVVVDHPQIGELAEYVAKRLSSASEAKSPLAAGESKASTEPAFESGCVIREYSADLAAKVDKFQHKHWPERAKHMANHWRWIALESAERFGVDPKLWLAIDEGQVVGETAGISVRLKFGEEIRDAAWLVDTAVDENFRTQAVGTQIVLEATRSTQLPMSLGQTEYMRQILVASGWQVIGAMQNLVYPLNLENVLKQKFGTVAGWAGQVTQGLRDIYYRPSLQHSVSVERVDRFDPTHDHIWMEKISRPFGIVRDSNYLNWRYVDHYAPDQFERLIFRNAEGELLGLAVVKIQQPAEESYDYRRALIVELVISEESGEEASECVNALISYIKEVDTVDAIQVLATSTLAQLLNRVGFLARGEDKLLMIYVNNLEKVNLPAGVLDISNWYCTWGDSDMLI